MTQPNDNLRERTKLDELIVCTQNDPCLDDDEGVYVCESHRALAQACNDARLDEHDSLCNDCVVQGKCDRRKQLEEGR